MSKFKYSGVIALRVFTKIKLISNAVRTVYHMSYLGDFARREDVRIYPYVYYSTPLHDRHQLWSPAL